MNNILQYSAEVEIYLEANGKKIEVASCLDNKCILRSPITIPPGKAHLIIAIDGVTKKRNIYLKDGISEDSSVVFVDFV